LTELAKGLAWAWLAVFCGASALALTHLARSVVSYQRWKRKLKRDHFTNRRAHMDDKL
jgi:hypothetical protein